MALLSAEIGTKKMVPVCRQLATSYTAGIPIIRSIDHVAANARDAKAKRVFSTMSEDLRNGTTLPDAARKHVRYLGPYFVNLVSAGDKGGRLDATFRDLADYYEDRLALKRKIIASLTYPAILISIAWFALTFASGMLKVALGSFDDASATSSGLISSYFATYVQFQTRALSLFAILAVVAVVLGQLGVLKYVWGWFATHLWPLSRVTRNFGMARFFRSFSLLTASGIDAVRSVQASANVIGNPYIERDLLRAVPAIRDGATLVESFATSRMMTPLAREMLAVGEESGDLEFHLKKASEYHADQASHAVQVATTISVQVIILAVVAFIGYFIISFYMNLYGGMFDALGV